MRIAAVVNDEVVSVFDVASRMQMVMLSSNIPDTPELRERIGRQVLRSLIDERLQMQEAKRQNITVTDSDVEKALKLDNAQKEKIKTIAGDAMAQMRELFQPGGDPQEMAKKRAAMQKESMDRVTAILSADQKAAWKELVGAPFEVQFQGRRRGGQ